MGGFSAAVVFAVVVLRSCLSCHMSTALNEDRWPERSACVMRIVLMLIASVALSASSLCAFQQMAMLQELAVLAAPVLADWLTQQALKK